jgi:putative phosphoribosyl transferase
MRFADRSHAGRLLAAKVARYQRYDPVVLGLARGGVPVAFEVADALGAPLDVFVARKLGAPGQPEFAIGAVAPGVTVLNEEVIRLLDVSDIELADVIARETREMDTRTARYRRGRVPLDLNGRVVLLVDDGIATGATVRAAVRSIRHLGAQGVVVATPTCAAESLSGLEKEADDVVFLTAPVQFYGVGAWYDDFSPTSDADVIRLLDTARQRSRLESHPESV